MSEHTVSFLVGDDIHAFLKAKDNKSAYLRRLIKADMQNGDAEYTSLRSQIETLEQQAQNHAESEEMLQERAEALRNTLNQKQQQRDHTLAEAKRDLRGTTLEPTNPAIKNWAEDIGMAPAKLCEELQQTQ